MKGNIAPCLGFFTLPLYLLDTLRMRKYLNLRADLTILHALGILLVAFYETCMAPWEYISLAAGIRPL